MLTRIVGMYSESGVLREERTDYQTD